ncbi:hypothetical protein [Aegicerativicinus sediminis]|uniref:hypothetical protein n=1 Tax=Aegicerativicinus sediminis TaxID=2893202 RepID=UPI001E2FBCB5|nr:hypothetical protein [Aegicerativicinus sediminis]
MPTCDDKLAGLFARNCNHKPKQGVSKKWYFNWDDVDREATTMVNKNTKVTALVLKAGAFIYPAEGNDKSSRARHGLVVGDYGNGYTHTDEFSVLYRGDDESTRIQELVGGARVGTIVKTIDTGEAGELSYHILGLESGMVIINDDWNTNENGGVSNVIVATKENEEEGTGKKIFLMPASVEPTDLAETEAWITANEYVAP